MDQVARVDDRDVLIIVEGSVEAVACQVRQNKMLPAEEEEGEEEEEEEGVLEGFLLSFLQGSPVNSTQLCQSAPQLSDTSVN